MVVFNALVTAYGVPLIMDVPVSNLESSPQINEFRVLLAPPFITVLNLAESVAILETEFEFMVGAKNNLLFAMFDLVSPEAFLASNAQQYLIPGVIFIESAEIFTKLAPVNGEPATSVQVGETVNEGSVPIINRTVVVCPWGLTVPFIFETTPEKAACVAVTDGAIPGDEIVLKITVFEIEEPVELLATKRQQ